MKFRFRGVRGQLGVVEPRCSYPRRAAGVLVSRRMANLLCTNYYSLASPPAQFPACCAFRPKPMRNQPTKQVKPSAPGGRCLPAPQTVSPASNLGEHCCLLLLRSRPSVPAPASSSPVHPSANPISASRVMLFHALPVPQSSLIDSPRAVVSELRASDALA